MKSHKDKTMNMTDEQMRIAIAEALGYTHVRIIKDIEGPPDAGIGHHPTKPHSVPDYLNDLKACAELEATLTDEEHNHYRAHIYGMTFNPRECFSATTRQRCIAYLKTKGLIP